MKCVYGMCPNGDNNKKGVELFRFPNPFENLSKCQRWVKACGLPRFSYAQVTSETCICGEHFVGGNGPTKKDPDPIPYSQGSEHCYTNKIKKNPFNYNRSCSVPQCNGRADGVVRLHSFPSNPKYRDLWAKAFLMKQLPRSPYACSQHFEPSCYFPVGSHRDLFKTRRKLKANAIPTLNMPEPAFLNEPCKKNRYKPCLRDVIRKQKFPKNSDRQNLWIKAVRRENWRPSRSSVLCSIHFQEKYIDRTSLCCVRLRDNAVPEIFPNNPVRLKRPIKKRNTKRTTSDLSGESPSKKRDGSSYNTRWTVVSSSEVASTRRSKSEQLLKGLLKCPEFGKVLERLVVNAGDSSSESSSNLIDVDISNSKVKAVDIPSQIESVGDISCTERESDEDEGDVCFTPVILEGSVCSAPLSDASSDIEIKEEPQDCSLNMPTVLFNGERIHVPDFIDCEMIPTFGECAVCCKKVSSKEVCTFCADCPQTPPLCLQPCFRRFHGY